MSDHLTLATEAMTGPKLDQLYDTLRAVSRPNDNIRAFLTYLTPGHRNSLEPQEKAYWAAHAYATVGQDDVAVAIHEVFLEGYEHLPPDEGGGPCAHHNRRQYGDRAVECSDCGLLVDLRTWQSRDLNGTGPLVLDYLRDRYPEVTPPPIDTRLASDPLPDSPSMLGSYGPDVAADPLAPTVLHGPTGVGKTSFLAAICATLDLRVVWYAGEGIDWAHQRLAAWHPQPERILVVRQPYPSQTDQYRTHVRAHAPDLAVVDPYVAWVTAFGWAENDAPTATLLRDLVHDLTGPVPILIAAAERKPVEGLTAIDRIRGSSGLAALAAISWRITTNHQSESYAAETKRRIGARSDISWALDLDTGLLTERTGLDHQDAEHLAALVQAVRDNRGQPVSRTRWGKAAGLPYIHQTVADRMLQAGRVQLVDNVYAGQPGYLPAD